MIIQFDPSAAESKVSSDTQARSSNPSNWIENRPNQFVPVECVPSGGEASKIVDFKLATYSDELTSFPNYVEEVKAKWFQGTDAIARQLADELLATTQENRAHQNPGRWSSWTILDLPEPASAGQSLPDAA